MKKKKKSCNDCKGCKWDRVRTENREDCGILCRRACYPDRYEKLYYEPKEEKKESLYNQLSPEERLKVDAIIKRATEEQFGRIYKEKPNLPEKLYDWNHGELDPLYSLQSAELDIIRTAKKINEIIDYLGEIK